MERQRMKKIGISVVAVSLTALVVGFGFMNLFKPRIKPVDKAEIVTSNQDVTETRKPVKVPPIEKTEVSLNKVIKPTKPTKPKEDIKTDKAGIVTSNQDVTKEAVLIQTKDTSKVLPDIKETPAPKPAEVKVIRKNTPPATKPAKKKPAPKPAEVKDDTVDTSQEGDWSFLSKEPPTIDETDGNNPVSTLAEGSEKMGKGIKFEDINPDGTVKQK